MVLRPRHGNNLSILSQMVDRHGKPLPKEHRPLMMMASEKSMAAKAELTRGVMTLQQTEQWHFLTLEPMTALRKPLVNFPDCTTASQCIGPIDMPNLEEGWQLTVEAKKVYGVDGLIRPGGPDPYPQSESSTNKPKPRRTPDTLEPITWHGTSDQAWDEILNIAGANNPFPKLVVELVATEDTLAYKCLQKHIPYLGICFNDFHRKILRQRLAQRVFEAMLDKESAFGTPDSCSALQALWRKDTGGDNDPDDEDDAMGAENAKAEAKSKAKAKGKVELKRKKRQAAAAASKKRRIDDAETDGGAAESAAAKRKALLDKLQGSDDDNAEGEEEEDDCPADFDEAA